MEVRIGSERAGKTVLEVVKQELGLSGGLLRHLKFSEGGILADGRHVTVRHVLQEGETLTLAVEDRLPQERLTPVDLPLTVRFENDDVVVPDKPADMPTHPSCGHWEDTVANALAYRYASRDIPFVFRPVNRLDRNTSGLLLVARNRISAASLGQAMQKGQIRKRYLAILCGTLDEPCGMIETYMRRTAQSVILRENCLAGEGGALARTRYRTLAAENGHSLVLCEPLTGRTHQLRVHFSGMGCPILGDDLYGSTSDVIGRHALHSFELTFPNPSDGVEITVFSPLPTDMASALRQLGLAQKIPSHFFADKDLKP